MEKDFMRKLLLVIVWTPATLMSLILVSLLLLNYSRVKAGKSLLVMETRSMLPKNGYEFYAALPQVLGSFTTAIAKEDARPEIIRQFLRKHDSPLEPFAPLMVEVADSENIDFRLIPAIGMCESNLGKKIPADSYNAWGYMVFTGQKQGASFTDWSEAIKVMAHFLSSKFYAQGLTTPEEMGPIYAPPSVNTDNSWAKCTRKFMDELI
ncbi:hypothetical protein A2699_02135 [Candidatus Gottesmanbacteria bacterium RIFCSPHIGHO2_01_FULL_43_15]|nr:MAG: hypothetical protein A2699_02135 [Candidatus Gottesmanbacteria bacterium RIFCSPHIGHO2_01_FULL_43_15]